MSDTTVTNPAAPALPSWALDMRNLFRSGSVAQFILHGNVFDLVPFGTKLLSLKSFLEEVMFAGYDAVLHYDRGRGIRATRGNEDWTNWLRQSIGDSGQALTLTREPGSAIELLDRYLLRTLNLQALTAPAAAAAHPRDRREKADPRAAAPPPPIPAADNRAPRKIAVIVDFAEFVVPRGDAIQLGGPFSANIVKVLGWANDPAILQSNIVTVLIAEGLHDLNGLLIDNPHASALRLPLPNESEMTQYVDTLATTQLPDLAAQQRRPGQHARPAPHRPEPRRRAHGAGARDPQRTAHHVVVADAHEERLDRARMPGPARIHRIEEHVRTSRRTRADQGMAARRHAAAAQRRAARAADGISDRGTDRHRARRSCVQCWAGELGIPCVVFKNFRDRWVGADRVEPRKDLLGAARDRPGRGVRGRGRSGRGQA